MLGVWPTVQWRRNTDGQRRCWARRRCWRRTCVRIHLRPGPKLNVTEGCRNGRPVKHNFTVSGVWCSRVVSSRHRRQQLRRSASALQAVGHKTGRRVTGRQRHSSRERRRRTRRARCRDIRSSNVRGPQISRDARRQSHRRCWPWSRNKFSPRCRAVRKLTVHQSAQQAVASRGWPCRNCCTRPCQRILRRRNTIPPRRHHTLHYTGSRRRRPCLGRWLASSQWRHRRRAAVAPRRQHSFQALTRLWRCTIHPALAIDQMPHGIIRADFHQARRR
mmetsp:Transcript_61479/g.164658  ORF Transcript_61479/g.164658 Transcript_61479/m.164658 type:complete len:275 (+) Transcript_61479:164-988(+)